MWGIQESQQFVIRLVAEDITVSGGRAGGRLRGDSGCSCHGTRMGAGQLAWVLMTAWTVNLVAWHVYLLAMLARRCDLPSIFYKLEGF